MSEGFFISRMDQIPHLTKRVEEIVDAGGVVSIELKNGRTRTGKQQAALEVWCRLTAELFNELGITRAVRSSIYRDGEMECSWRQSSVKDEIWRPMQEAITKIESTTKCSTSDYPKIFDELVRAMGNKGITLPKWPVRQGKGD